MTEEETTAPDDGLSVDNDKMLEAIKKANDAAERTEKANEKFEQLLNKQAAMQVQNTLAGTAAVTPPDEKKEETPQEYAKKVMSGEETKDT